MGTSKGYISPTRPEWSSAKSAIDGFLRNRDSGSRDKAIAKYAEAMRTNGTSAAFPSAAGNMLAFARGVSVSGLDNTLIEFGREDLIGKSPDEILSSLLDMFTNGSSTLEESIAYSALSRAFENLGIETPEDLGNININDLLREMVIAFINNNFDLRYYEKINQGRTPAEVSSILKEVHGYITGTLRNELTDNQIGKMDLANLKSSDLISAIVDDAYRTFIDFYGG